MTVDLAGNIINVARHRTIALEHARGTTIVCIRGLLWVTEQRRGEDVLLEPGERYALSGNGKALVTALEVGAAKLIDPPSLSSALLATVSTALSRWWTGQFDVRAMHGAARRYGMIV